MTMWTELLPELQARVFAFIESNEVAVTMRLVCKATAALLHGPKHTTVRLWQPAPPHAFALHWGRPAAMRSLTYRKRMQLLCLTAISGSITNMEVLLPRVNCLLTGAVLAAAASAGQLAMCQWLRQRGCPWTMAWCSDAEYGNAAEAAGMANQRQVCEWFIAAGSPRAVAYAAAGAAAGGHVDLLHSLMLQGKYQLDPGMLLTGVAKGCDLATLRRVMLGYEGGQGALGDGDGQGSSYWHTAPVMAAAAGSPTPDWRAKVEWLAARWYPACAEACTAAARRPDALERLAWLRARGFPLAPNAGVSMRWVAARADLEALEGVLAEGAATGGEGGLDLRGLAACAAAHGHLEVLQALLERGAVDGGCLAVAAASGHLHLVAWAVEALGAAVLTDELLTAAARSGSVELMAWLRQRGCPWNGSAHGNTYAEAAKGGCEEALEWLAAGGCPMQEASSAYVSAGRNGDLATLASLRRLRCPWGPDTVEQAARLCPVGALRWLLDNGCPVDWDSAEEAVRGCPDADARRDLIRSVRVPSDKVPKSFLSKTVMCCLS